MRNIAIIAVCVSLFGAHAAFISEGKDTKTQAATQPTFAGQDTAGSAALERILDRLESLEQKLAASECDKPCECKEAVAAIVDAEVIDAEVETEEELMTQPSDATDAETTAASEEAPKSENDLQRYVSYRNEWRSTGRWGRRQLVSVPYYYYASGNSGAAVCRNGGNCR